jgi:membrane protease YdiL (CAAX protease family)
MMDESDPRRGARATRVEVPPHPTFGRRFWPLLAAGGLGVAGVPLILVPIIEASIGAGPGPALSLIQPALLVAVGAALGAVFAPRLGFASHLAGLNVRGPLRSELPFAIGSGLAAGIAIAVADHFAFATDYSGAAPRSIVGDLVFGALYGGLAEEVMMRWGLMSLVARIGARLFDRSLDAPSPRVAIASIVVVTLIFAAGHLPAAAAIGPLGVAAVTRVLLLNSVAGVLFGWLFWRRSLEAAMVAHAGVHVAFALARLVA